MSDYDSAMQAGDAWGTRAEIDADLLAEASDTPWPDPVILSTIRDRIRTSAGMATMYYSRAAALKAGDDVEWIPEA